MQTIWFLLFLNLLGGTFSPQSTVSSSGGTRVYFMSPYCGGPAPTEEMIEASSRPHPVPITRFYLIPSQGDCPDNRLPLPEAHTGTRPRGTVEVMTDSSGRFSLPNGLPPGQYCLGTEAITECRPFESSFDGQVPACFTVGSNRQLPDSLIIYMLCGGIPRP